MGLNWAAGARGAARGVEFMQKDQAQSIDAMYKEISDANLRRFKGKEIAAKREFTAGESAKDRASREKVSADKLAAQTARDELSATQRSEDKAAQAERDRATEEYRNQQQENQRQQKTAQGSLAESKQTEFIRHNKATEASSAATAQNTAAYQKESIKVRQDAEARRVDKQIEDEFDSEIKSYGLFPTDEQRAGAVLNRDRKKARARLKDNQTSSFDKAFGRLGRSSGGIPLAASYAEMTPAERKSVNAQAKKFVGSKYTHNGEEKRLSAGGAFAKAIRGYGYSEPDNNAPENPVNTNTDQPGNLVPEVPSPLSGAQGKNKSKLGGNEDFFEEIKRGYGFGSDL